MPRGRGKPSTSRAERAALLAWVPGHHERERVGYIWREPRWEMRDGVYVKVEGTWVVR